MGTLANEPGVGPTHFEARRRWCGTSSRFEVVERGGDVVAELVDEKLARRVAYLLEIARGCSDAAVAEIAMRGNGLPLVAQLAKEGR